MGYIFVAASMGLSSFKFELWAPKDASFLQQSAFWTFKAIQGHPRSMILVPIESAYTTSVACRPLWRNKRWWWWWL